MQAQTEAALQPLLPDLFAAEGAGRISHFEPLLNSGVLKIVYDAASGVPDIAGRTVYDLPGDAAPSGLHMAGAPTMSGSSSADLGAQGGCPVSGGFYSLSMSEDASFSADCLILGQIVQGNVRDGAGNLVAVYSGAADGSGQIWNAYFYWTGPYKSLRTGFTVTFQLWNGVGWNSFSQVVPDMRFTAIDKAHTRVTGKAAPGQSVEAIWVHPNLDSSNSGPVLHFGTTASATGSWSMDFGTTPMRGGDYLGMASFPGSNFMFTRSMYVPFTYCQLGGSICSVSGFAGKRATLQVVQGSKIYSFSGHFDPDGRFYVNLVKPNGSPLVIKAGNKVTGNNMPQYKIPRITTGIDYPTDVVSGLAPANKYFSLSVYALANGGDWFQTWAGSNSSGLYAQDFTSSADLVSILPYFVQLAFVQPTTGNATVLNRPFAP